MRLIRFDGQWLKRSTVSVSMPHNTSFQIQLGIGSSTLNASFVGCQSLQSKWQPERAIGRVVRLQSLTTILFSESRRNSQPPRYPNNCRDATDCMSSRERSALAGRHDWCTDSLGQNEQQDRLDGAVDDPRFAASLPTPTPFAGAQPGQSRPLAARTGQSKRLDKSIRELWVDR